MIPVLYAVYDTPASSAEQLYSDTPLSPCHAGLQHNVNNNIPSCKC